MFETLINGIDDEIAHRIFKVEIAVPQAPHIHVEEHAAGGELGADEVSNKKSKKIENNLPPRGTVSSSSGSGSNSSLVSIASPSVVASSLNSGGSNVPPSKKLGRNDPCWCGSGKKYKKCHYPN